MRMKRVAIPGKVMLSGEYAVLYGGTAVLVPVPRNLVLTNTAKPPEMPYRKMISAAREYPIPELREHEHKHGVPHISVDYTQFYSIDQDGTRLKLGLGSSSAEAVGTIALRYECAGIPWRERVEDVARHAFHVHKKVQGGRGSGADVAACAYQVPIRYRFHGDSFEAEPTKVTAGIAGIPTALAWSGIPANTRVLISKFQSWVERGDKGVRGLLKRLIDASDRLADSWFKDPPRKLFEKIDQFNETLRKCARAASLPYFLPVHESVENWAVRHGGKAKPTGAGGGDLILLLGTLPYDQLAMTVIPLLKDLSTPS